MILNLSNINKESYNHNINDNWDWGAKGCNKASIRPTWSAMCLSIARLPTSVGIGKDWSDTRYQPRSPNKRHTFLARKRGYGKVFLAESIFLCTLVN